KVGLLTLVFRQALPTPVTWLVGVCFELTLAILWLYVIMIAFYGIAGFLLQGRSSPVYDVLAYMCEPLVSRIRRGIPSLVAGFDLSFLWALIALNALILLIRDFHY